MIALALWLAFMGLLLAAARWVHRKWPSEEQQLYDARALWVELARVPDEERVS